ncbi:MAG: uroporphyrinogen decarboxylase family protein [Eubacteriales bacterium]
MNNRQRTMAVLNYEKYDRLPIVHFGYWHELLEQWHAQGHITLEEFNGYGDGNDVDKAIMERLGFDYCWTAAIGANNGLIPGFEYKELEHTSDGFVIYQNHVGLIEKAKKGIVSIPASIGTLLKDRQAWEELYLPRLKLSGDGCRRVPTPEELAGAKAHFDTITDRPVGVHAGSLYGSIRDMLGVEELSYLAADDFDLYVEIIEKISEICYDNMRYIFESGIKFDFMHYWEDICFKNGPLVSPAIFKEYVAPGYKRLSELANKHGVNIISLDCDGCIDKLVPIWLENGVNTMFPIEVGTWRASLAPWREQYGRELRGVGGMDKVVLLHDYAAIDEEIERLKPIVELGGYIPCPDHRLAPDTKWENVQYYCEKMKRAFS